MHLNPTILIFAILIFLTFFLRISVYEWFRDLRYLKKIIKTGVYLNGVIVDFEENEDADGGKLFMPVFEYEFFGQTFRKVSQTSRKVKPQIGQHVDVLINKANTVAFIDVQEEINAKVFGIFFFLILVSFLVFVLYKMGLSQMSLSE